MKLNIAEEKTIKFDISINGTDASELSCRLVIAFNNIEYSFPSVISNEYIATKIPSLIHIINNIKNSDILTCRLEVYKDGFYSSPWQGDFNAEVPMNESIITSVTAKPIQENKSVIHYKSSQKKSNLEESEKDKFIKFLMEKLKSKKSQSKTVVSKKAIPGRYNHIKTDPIVSESDMIQQKLTSLLTEKKMTNLLPDQPTKKSNTQKVKVITLEHCVQLMKSKGMTSKKTQDMILEKAKEIGGDDAQSMYSAIEKLLGLEQKNNPTTMYEKTMMLRN
jgi:hypothetical protein